MAIKIQELAFILKARDYLSPVLAKVTGQMEQLNAAAKQTEYIREAAGHLATMGAAMVAVGGVGALAIKSVLGGAAEIDESMHHLDTALDAGTTGIREHAEALKFAQEMSVKFNYATKDVIDNVYSSMSFIGNYKLAIANTAASLAVAKGNRGDPKEVGEQMAIMVNDFVDKTKSIADQVKQVQHLSDLVAFTARHGAFNNVGELMAGVSTAIGSIKGAGIGPEDMLATLQAFSAVGLRGSESGTATMEVLARFATGKLQSVLGVALAKTKSGSLDLIGTLVNLRKEVGTGAITVDQFMKAAEALGIRGNRAMALDIPGLVQFQKMAHDPKLINGAALGGAAQMMQAFNEQMGVLGKILDHIKDAFGDALLGPIQKIGAHLAPILTAIAKFAEANPKIVKFAALFVAIGSAFAIVAGGALLAVGGLLALGSFIPVGGAVLAISVALGTALAATTAALAAWAPSTLRKVLHFFEAIPGWLLGHWKGVLTNALLVAFLGPLGVALAVIRSFGPQLFQAGAHLLDSLVAGMKSKVAAVAAGAAGIAGRIRDYFVGHSPPPLGPLHELNRVHIVETIAETMKPAPMMAAIQRIAQMAAIAVPLAITGPATSAFAARMPTIAAPAASFATESASVAMPVVAPAAARASAGGEGATVIHYHAPAVTIHAVGGDPAALKRAVLEALRESAHDVQRILDDYDIKRTRTKF